jgi:hypothetical protein
MKQAFLSDDIIVIRVKKGIIIIYFDRFHMTLQSYIQNKKYLFWYTPQLDSLSDEAIIESIIKYGTWEDLTHMIHIQKPTIKEQYQQLITKSRCNLTQKEIHFMNKLLENVH